MCEKLDLADFEAGVRVAGQKFYFLKNEAAFLEAALVQYAMHTCVKAGYTPIITPDLARVDVLEGIGFMPRDSSGDAAGLHRRRYRPLPHRHRGNHARRDAPRPHLRRNGTAEALRRVIALLPHRSRGCLVETPADSYRVHQFTKVEMFAFCTPENSEETSPRNQAHSRSKSSTAWG